MKMNIVRNLKALNFLINSMRLMIILIILKVIKMHQISQLKLSYRVYNYRRLVIQVQVIFHIKYLQEKRINRGNT